jgi:DNA (cytosine-5)-methyltransferase 1
MRELSLFTGAGGGLLGTKLLGWTPIGYVENNEYCQRVIAQRIEDGFLEDAPIFGDIRAFLGEGYAASYTGMVDVVTAGFPCQGWSTAARGRQSTKRDLWPETLRCIEIIKPGKILLENVSGKAIRRAKLDLEKTGFLCKRAAISSAALGAADNRKREWLLAHANGNGQPPCSEYEEMASVCCLPRLDAWDEEPSEYLGMDARVANRVDRLKALGNGQVPAVVRAVWGLLGGCYVPVN